MGLNGNQDTEERNSYLLFPSGPTKTPVVRHSTLYFLKSSTEHPFLGGARGAGGKELKIPTNWIYVYINTGHRTGKDHFFISIPEKGNAKDCSNYHTIALISHASKIMFKILQARLQQYMNWEYPDIQAGFRTGRGTRDQIANIRWITEKSRESPQKIYFCFTDKAKAFDCVDLNKLEYSYRDGNTRQHYLPPEKPICRTRSSS